MRLHVSLVVLLVPVNILLLSEFANCQPEYSKSEKAAIEKLRESVKNALYKDYMKSDTYLVRWLRGREFDQNAARQMLLTALKWRKQNDIDNILQEKGLDSLGKAFFPEGTDNEGSAVGTILASRWDTRAQIVAGKRKHLLREWPRFFEAIEQEVMRKVGAIGNNATTGKTDVFTLIIDLQGYNLRQHACLTCFSVYFEWIRSTESYYPEYIKHLLMINAPRVFGPLLNLLRPLMSKQARSVLKVFGPDKKEWNDFISKLVPADQLRVEVGGTRKD